MQVHGSMGVYPVNSRLSGFIAPQVDCMTQQDGYWTTNSLVLLAMLKARETHYGVGSGSPTPPIYTPGRGTRYGFLTALLATFSPPILVALQQHCVYSIAAKAPPQRDATKSGNLQERCPNILGSFSRTFRRSPCHLLWYKLRGNETDRSEFARENCDCQVDH